jgi:hypothetical protein
MFQVLTSECNEFPISTAWNHRIEKIDDWKLVDKSKPIFCIGDLLNENVRAWLKHDYPAIYFARGYVGNHQYKRENWMWRAGIRGWANTKILNVPYSRWHLLNLKKNPWKVKKVKNVLLAPSKMTSKIWSRQKSAEWVESMMEKFPGADVRVRLKGEKPSLRWQTLWNDLDWSDLVVSQGSAITCEAFWYGKKVISLEPCSTWAAEKFTLADWQNPEEPKARDLWHEHLAWSQFTRDEWQSGKVFELIKLYYGDVLSYSSGHTYNFK